MEVSIEPAALPIAKAAEYLSLGRSQIYNLIQSRHLDARKCGRRILVLKGSCDEWLAALPRAELSIAPRLKSQEGA